MEFAQYFPVWDKLTAAQQSLLMDTVTERTIQKGETVHNGAVSPVFRLLYAAQHRV